MDGILSKSASVIFLLILLSFGLKAQHNRFIYIQSENRQPFYVRMDKKVLSSSMSGYIIISKLIDSIYAVSVGFPKNEWPEQKFAIEIKDADAGFLLKYFEESGWGLFNIQSMEVLMSNSKAVANINNRTESSIDSFEGILSAVMNDPSIAQKANISEETLLVVNTPENAIDAKAEIKGEEKLVIPVQNEVEFKSEKNEISKLMFDSTAEGLKMVYSVKVNGRVDTVNINILTHPPITQIEPEKDIEKPNGDGAKVETTIKDSRFIDMELQNPNIKIDSGTNRGNNFVITEKKVGVKELPVSQLDSIEIKKDSSSVILKPNCESIATHDDFLYLRKLMAAEEKESAMTEVAINKFISICFTTEQIKNLGALFINEEERYKFFVASYPFVSDSQNFGLLQDQLTDIYFITRFKSMLPH